MDKKIIYADMGGSHIALLVGTVRDDNSVHIIGEQSIESADVKYGIIQKTSGAAHKVNTLTKYVQNAYNIENVERVSTSINAQTMKTCEYSLMINITSQPITEADLLRAEQKCKADLENDKTYVFESFPLAYFVDGKEVEDPIGKRGSQLKVDYQTVLGHYLANESYVKCFERTGLEVDYIHLGVEAVATAVLSEEDRDEACVLLMLGSTKTTMAIYDNGVLEDMLVVKLGGEHITNDIAEIGISRKNAELIKIKKGKAMKSLEDSPILIKIPNVDIEKEPVKIDTSFLANIIEARLEEILKPIIDRINSTAYSLNRGIILTGRAAKLEGLTEYLFAQTGLDVRFGDHSDWLSEDTNSQYLDTRYAEAVGGMLLTNELLEEKNSEEEVDIAIESKIRRTSFISKAIKKVSNKITDEIPTLFDFPLSEDE